MSLISQFVDNQQEDEQLYREQEMNISPGQLDGLIELIQDDKWTTERYDTEFDELYTKLKMVTEKQKKYLYHLIWSGKRHKLREMYRSLNLTKI